jgi:hypothetical protein
MNNQHSISEMADALEVSASGYADHLKKGERPRRRQDRELGGKLQAIFQESRKTYGLPRHGLHPVQKRRFRPQTTQSDPSRPAAPNWLQKMPAPERSNQQEGQLLRQRRNGKLLGHAQNRVFGRSIPDTKEQARLHCCPVDGVFNLKSMLLTIEKQKKIGVRDLNSVECVLLSLLYEFRSLHPRTSSRFGSLANPLPPFRALPCRGARETFRGSPAVDLHGLRPIDLARWSSRYRRMPQRQTLGALPFGISRTGGEVHPGR